MYAVEVRHPGLNRLHSSSDDRPVRGCGWSVAHVRISSFHNKYVEGKKKRIQGEGKTHREGLLLLLHLRLRRAFIDSLMPGLGVTLVDGAANARMPGFRSTFIHCTTDSGMPRLGLGFGFGFGFGFTLVHRATDPRVPGLRFALIDHSGVPGLRVTLFDHAGVPGLGVRVGSWNGPG
jgi:hypothetical protein